MLSSSFSLQLLLTTSIILQWAFLIDLFVTTLFQRHDFRYDSFLYAYIFSVLMLLIFILCPLPNTRLASCSNKPLRNMLS